MRPRTRSRPSRSCSPAMPAPSSQAPSSSSMEAIRSGSACRGVSGGLPPSTAFELSRMSSGAWSQRFVICAAAVVNELAFLIYGSRFAKLLELPERPTRGIPITRQLPGRYLTLFTEGCRHAIAQGAPVRLSGVVVDYGQIELYRAAFMPLAMQLTSSKQLVFGTFNRRIGPKATSSDAICTTYNWLFENIQADRGPRPSWPRTAANPRAVRPPHAYIS